MNRMILIVMLFLGTVGNAQEVPLSKTADPVIHVHTAMDHISILQFEDPVAKVAAGSPGFQIERDGNTVLIKPLRQNASTDLLVWTGNNNRYAYELDPPGEVKNMNFAIDAPASKPKEAASSPSSMADVADMVLIRALLGSQQIDSSRVKRTDPLELKIQQIFRSAQSVYIHYSLRNTSKKTVKLTTLTVFELVRMQRPEISLMAVLHSQIEEQALQDLGKLKERQISLARSERQNDLLQPGDSTEGVLVTRESLSSPIIVQLAIANDAGATTKAAVVF